MRKRFAARPQSVGERLAGEIDDGVDANVIGDLIEIGHEVEWRAQSGGLGGIARQHDYVMSGGG